MKITLLKSFLVVIGIMLFPSIIYAADLNITCYENQKPSVTTSTKPLFQLSGFTPGQSSQKTILVTNSDQKNSCTIYIQGSGDSNQLTDKIFFTIDSIYTKTLSDFIKGDNIQIANLQPNQTQDRTITLYFDKDANNSLTNNTANFNIKINSQWGSEQGDVLGDQTKVKTQNTEEGSTTNSNGNTNNTDNTQQEVLGTVTDNGNSTICSLKTLWWIPLLVELLLTIFVLFINKSFFQNFFVKVLITTIIAIIAFFVAKQIGCGCNITNICKYSWILNIIMAISPTPILISRLIRK